MAGRWRWIWGTRTVRGGLSRAKASRPQDTTPCQALKTQRRGHCRRLRGLQVEHIMWGQEPISRRTEGWILEAEG